MITAFLMVMVSGLLLLCLAKEIKMSDINELEKAALELAALYKKVKDMASAQDFGVELDDYDGEVRLEDWLNSSCYGEEAGRTFVAQADGKIWYPSSC